MIWLALGSPDLISMEHEGLSFGLYPVSDLLLGLLFNPDRASNEASSFLSAKFQRLLVIIIPHRFNKVYFVHHQVQSKCSTNMLNERSMSNSLSAEFP